MRRTVPGDRSLSLIASLVLTVAITTVIPIPSCDALNPSAGSSTQSTAQEGPKPATAASHTSKVIQGNVQKKTVGRAPSRKINFGQTASKHSPNSFTDISNSMPAAAVRENLARRHELPSEQTAVLRPGGTVGGAAGVTNGGLAPNATGNSPDILLPNGVAVPESKGAVKNGFYK